MYLNGSIFPLILTLHSLELPQTSIYPAFMLGMTTYLFILLCNLTIVVTICLNRNLHKPMYILLLNMPINDAMGATSLFPQLLYSIWSQDRSISYSACLLQGFIVHLYGGASYVILTAMAYDRYIAICCPLRYGAILTTNNLSDAKIKALQTCGTHLVVFLFLEFNTLFPLLAHRSESVPAHLRRVFSISVLVFPPIVNPLIYGFKTQEIRQKILTCFKRKIISV
ncbi:hypothetical protein PO909_003012 [Leuciscus waleckii]